MYIRMHVIGRRSGRERLHDPGAVHAHVEGHGLTAVEKAIHMFIEKTTTPRHTGASLPTSRHPT